MSQVTSQVIHKPVQSGGAFGLPKLKPTDLSRENEREVLELQQQEKNYVQRCNNKRKSYVFGSEKEDSKTEKRKQRLQKKKVS